MNKTENLQNTIEKKKEQYFGRMNDPDCSAYTRGLCGDEMEFYLVIKDEKITDIKFYTEGCNSTIMCGTVAADLAKEKTIEEVLKISAGDIIETLKDVPALDNHCSILAITTLYRAIAEYLLKP